MKYYEFTKTDYYALIAASDMMKAMKIYVEVVAYDSVEELRLNSLHPNEISKEHALLKLFLSFPAGTVKELKEEFDSCVDYPLLIDKSLL